MKKVFKWVSGMLALFLLAKIFQYAAEYYRGAWGRVTIGWR